MSQASDSDDAVTLCCCRFKRTPANEKAVKIAKKTMEDIFESVFDTLRAEAADSGTEIPIEFKGKMLKWGAKMNLFQPEPTQK
jgi:hypothetical protein